jgi:TatA/E family protein of Tat protein translocase
MFGLGTTELLVILALALLVFGPKKLPDLASSLGKAIRSFRRATTDLQDQLELDENVKRPFNELKSALRDEPAPVVPPASSPAAAAPPAPAVSPPAAAAASASAAAPAAALKKD